MKVEVINTGTELLLGNVVNTHLAYLGKTLFSLGWRIARQVTVPDGASIQKALLEAFPRCDLIIVTGGLGPTTDDITRELTAQLLGLPLIENQEIMDTIAARLARRSIVLRDRMRNQAFVPQGATVLPNENGTAPGLYLPPLTTPAWASPHLILLPGPPRELKPMFEKYAIPILQALPDVERSSNECRIYHIVGMGESLVEEAVGLELDRRGDIEVGYCARPNEVDLRLIAPAAILDEVEPKVLSILGKHLVSQDGRSLEEVVVEKLIAAKLTVATAESCTGGFLAHRLTNVSGASAIFHGGYVTYDNRIKAEAIGVPAELIERHGAVSEAVARAMAEGARRTAAADFGIGITGIAGPTGGTPEKPVGTVFIALARPEGETLCVQKSYPSDRETFKVLASQIALDLLREELA